MLAPIISSNMFLICSFPSFQVSNCKCITHFHFIPYICYHHFTVFHPFCSLCLKQHISYGSFISLVLPKLNLIYYQIYLLHFWVFSYNFILYMNSLSLMKASILSTTFLRTSLFSHPCFISPKMEHS